MTSIPYNVVLSIAKNTGLELLSVTNVAPNPRARKSLSIWQEKGFAGTMDYMMRSPELLSSPSQLMPEAKSLLVFSLYYSREAVSECPEGFGRVARYAWGRDYHRVLKRRLKQFMSAMQSCSSRPLKWKAFSDAVPLMERAFAERAGVGFVGKNTMVITPRRGSFFFLAEILIDYEIEPQPVLAGTAGCGSCSRCLDSCPTGAIEEPFVVNANKCISYLTIEKRGVLEKWERLAVGEWIFGCDICQEVCPHNHTALKFSHRSDLDDFNAKHGTGPFLNLAATLGIRSDEDFRAQFAGTPLMRAKRSGLLRNAALVVANTRALVAGDALCQAATTDPDDTVRLHCVWGLGQMISCSTGAQRRLMLKTINLALHDISDSVVQEAKMVMETKERREERGPRVDLS